MLVLRAALSRFWVSVALHCAGTNAPGMTRMSPPGAAPVFFSHTVTTTSSQKPRVYTRSHLLHITLHNWASGSVGKKRAWFERHTHTHLYKRHRCPRRSSHFGPTTEQATQTPIASHWFLTSDAGRAPASTAPAWPNSGWRSSLRCLASSATLTSHRSCFESSATPTATNRLSEIGGHAPVAPVAKQNHDRSPTLARR